MPLLRVKISRLFFLLFLFSCPALAQELVRCYPLNRLESGELCLPSISQGKRIIFSQVNANSIPELQDLFPLTTAENKAEQFLLQNFPQNHFLVANSLLGKMGNLFNQAANFGGPNCYQSALYASSSPYSTEWRYVSPEEFELNLKLAYDKVDQPQFGDIVVYEATGERGHAAVYLFDDLVFQFDANFKVPYIFQPLMILDGISRVFSINEFIRMIFLFNLLDCGLSVLHRVVKVGCRDHRRGMGDRAHDFRYCLGMDDIGVAGVLAFVIDRRMGFVGKVMGTLFEVVHGRLEH